MRERSQDGKLGNRGVRKTTIDGRAGTGVTQTRRASHIPSSRVGVGGKGEEPGRETSKQGGQQNHSRKWNRDRRNTDKERQSQTFERSCLGGTRKDVTRKDATSGSRGRTWICHRSEMAKARTCHH